MAVTYQFDHQNYITEKGGTQHRRWNRGTMGALAPTKFELL